MNPRQNKAFRLILPGDFHSLFPFSKKLLKFLEKGYILTVRSQ